MGSYGSKTGSLPLGAGLWREDRSFRFVPVDTACTILLEYVTLVINGRDRVLTIPLSRRSVFAEIGTSLDGYLLHRGKPIHQQEFRTLGIQSGDRLHWRFRMRGGEKWPRGSDTSSADPSNANAYASSSNAIASTSKHPFADSDDDWEDPVLFAELDSEEDQPRVKKPKARAPRIVSDTEEEEDQPATLYEHAVKASTISKNKGKGKARAPPSEPSSEDESASTDGEDMLDDSDGDSNGEDDLDEDQIAVDDEDAQEAFRLSMVRLSSPVGLSTCPLTPLAHLRSFPRPSHGARRTSRSFPSSPQLASSATSPSKRSARRPSRQPKQMLCSRGSALVKPASVTTTPSSRPPSRRGTRRAANSSARSSGAWRTPSRSRPRRPRIPRAGKMDDVSSGKLQ